MDPENLRSELLFIHVIHPVIYICGVFGYLPVQIRKFEVRFRWLSFQVLYFLVVSTFIGVVGTFNFAARMMILKEMPDVQTDFFSEIIQLVTGLPISFLSLLQLFISLVYQFIFYIGLSTARDVPASFEKLHDFCLDIVKGTPRERLDKIIREVKGYTARSIGFFGLLAVLNLGCVTWESLRRTDYMDGHALVMGSYFVWQFWFTSHGLTAIFPTLIVIILKSMLHEIYLQLQVLLKVDCDQGNANWLVTKPVKIMFEDDGPSEKDKFHQEFLRLKRAYLGCEEIIKFQFIGKGFIFVEILVALVFASNAVTGALKGNYIAIFWGFFHTFFLYRLISNAADMVSEVTNVLDLLLKASFQNVPMECGIEVQTFTTKLLTTDVPVLKFMGTKFTRNLFQNLKLFALGVVVVFFGFGYLLATVLVGLVSAGDAMFGNFGIPNDWPSVNSTLEELRNIVESFEST